MKVVKIENVEEILKVGSCVGKIEISADEVMRYIYVNKNRRNSQINIDELRNVYVKSVKKSYAKKKYEDNIFFNSEDIKKICYN